MIGEIERLLAINADLYEALVEAERAIDDCLEFRSHLNYRARDKARAAIERARAVMVRQQLRHDKPEELI